MQNFLCGLTTSQLQAVQTVDGPLLILAGAGTGKTRTLVSRLAHLATQAASDPARLLAITFTAKAAEEMRSRLAAMSLPGTDAGRLRVCTIHSLCLDILKKYGGAIGIPADFNLVTPADRAACIKQAAVAAGQDGSRSLKKLDLEITREKNGQSGYKGLSELGRAYQEQLQARGLLDFDDLILKAIDLFAAAPDALASLRSRYSHISIDEFQDMNGPQYDFMRALCPGRANICVVGDPDQAIYGFRGAAPDIFLRFQTDYPDARQVRLETNYRSSATILAAAQAVIVKNNQRIEKTLNSMRPGGELLELWDFATDQEEAAFVSREIEKLMGGMRFESLGSDGDDKVQGFGDIAVLYRLHQQGRLLKKALASRGIPVDMAATRSIFEQPAVQNILALLETLVNTDADMALAGLLADSPFAVSPAVLRELRSAATGSTLYGALADPPAACADSVRMRLRNLAALISRCQQRAAELPLDRLIAEIWEAMFSAEQEKTDDYFAFLTAAMAFSGMPASQAIPLLLEKTALLQDGEVCSSGNEAVRLMTIHSAKGLEFPVIFITGFEEGLLPYLGDADALRPGDIEEERRLLYVAMTRAKDRLYVSSSRSRFFFGERRPMALSCFAADIPSQHCRSLSRKAPQKPRQKQLKLFA